MKQENYERLLPEVKTILEKLDLIAKYRNRMSLKVMDSFFDNKRLEHDYETIFTIKIDSFIDRLETSFVNDIAAIQESYIRKVNYYDMKPEEAIKRVAREYAYKANDVFYLVKFPELTVTNENNRSTDVRDLFACIQISNDVFNGMSALVSTYTYNKAIAGYAFSHIVSVRLNDKLKFGSCCLGSGPLSGEALNMRQYRSVYNRIPSLHITTMCNNVCRFFTCESLSGGPFIGLDTIGNGMIGYSPVSRAVYNTKFTSSIVFNYIVKECFLRMHHDKVLLSDCRMSEIKCSSDKFAYTYGFKNVVIRDHSDKFTIIFSKYFRKVFVEFSLLYDDMPSSELLVKDKVLIKAVVLNDKLLVRTQPQSIRGFTRNGELLFQFKGKPVNLVIEPPIKEQEDVREQLFINQSLSLCLSKLYRDFISNGVSNKSSSKFVIV